jgi:hypothetical protein
MKCTTDNVKSDVGDGSRVCQMPGQEVVNDSLCHDNNAVASGVAFSELDNWLKIHILSMVLSCFRRLSESLARTCPNHITNWAMLC